MHGMVVLTATAGEAALMLTVAMLGPLVARLCGCAVLDIPNHCSSHSVPAPRSGGLAVAASVLACWGAVLAATSALTLPLAVMLAGGLGLTVLAWVWFTNLYNFMDGISGVEKKPQRVGMRIHHGLVLGTVHQPPEILVRLRRLILTRYDMDSEVVTRLLVVTQCHDLTLARMPRMTALHEGVGDAVRVQPVAIKYLLDRPQSPLDRKVMARLIASRRLLVTDAAGSLGSELALQVVDLGPATLTLVESSEFALYSTDMEIPERAPSVPRAACIADVCETRRLDAVFAAARPDLVLHAAALKHVPLVEAASLKGLRTNTPGPRDVDEACGSHGVDIMVLISADKSANPANVMGTSKRMAEIYRRAGGVAGRESGGTRFAIVRFGNALGSTGSVVPPFQRQLAKGGPLTVTRPDMGRYFMTVREAMELLLQVSSVGTEGDGFKGCIFVLDMGRPVKIADLAPQRIGLSSFEPEKDIAIRFTGLRPGEKLLEEFFHSAEPPVQTDHDGNLVAVSRLVNMAVVDAALDRLDEAYRAGDEATPLVDLVALVPEYYQRPSTDVRAKGGVGA